MALRIQISIVPAYPELSAELAAILLSRSAWR
jgi:hypothetical protein